MLRLSQYAVLAGCAVAIAAGQVLFKLAAGSMGRDISGMILSRPLWAAITVYGLATVVWVLQLRTVPITLAHPFMAVSFILMPFLGKICFGEPLTVGKLAGATLISVGIIVSVSNA